MYKELQKQFSQFCASEMKKSLLGWTFVVVNVFVLFFYKYKINSKHWLLFALTLLIKDKVKRKFLLETLHGKVYVLKTGTNIKNI